MIPGLCVGWGNWIGADLLRAVRERNVQMVRSDYLGVQNAEDMGNLIGEVVGEGLTPLTVVRPDQCAWAPPVEQFGPLDFECWNEPDIGTDPTPRMTPADYGREVWDAWERLPFDHRLWAGAISNLDVDSLEWLKASIAGWPASVGVSAHWYPPKGSMPPNNAHHGFGSRQHQVERLKAVIGDRPWGISELGYNDAEGLTAQQVFDACRWERDFWREMGAAFLCLYQINCGKDRKYYMHRMGWRDEDGWLPVSEVFRA